MADRSEFSAVVRDRLIPWRRTAYFICGDWSRSEDLVQTALLRIYAKWHRIDVSGIDAYARKVIVRLAIDEARRPHHRFEVSAEPPDHAGRTPDREGILDVRAALRSLPPKHRAVLVLRFYADLSITETAGALGVSEGTVKSQTARALDALRTAMDTDAADVSLPLRKEMKP